VAAVERRVAQPGDRICTNCSEPNDPARKFCRRCGASLAAATAVPERRPPWWRRIFARKPREYAAGERRSSMAASKRRSMPSTARATYVVRWALGILFALGLVGFVAIPSFQGLVIRTVSGGFDQIRRFVAPTLTIETPVAVSAADQVADHPVGFLFDRKRFTDWRAAGETATATATFEGTVDLGAVIIHPGIEDGFLDLRRPSRVEFAFADGTVVGFDLEDVPDLQRFDLNVSGVEAVEIRVVDTSGPGAAPIAFAEIEFFTKH
jgi:hypothetical protein